MALRDRQFDPQENEARLCAVLDHVLDGIITIGEEGVILSFNRAAEAIFGFTAREVVGRDVNVLMPEPYHSAHGQYIRRYVAGGRPKIIGIGREVTGRRKDGSEFPMELTVSEMRVGDTRMFSGIVRDISERRQAEAHLGRSNRLLDAIRHAQSLLIEDVSPFSVFDALLSATLAVTDSEYGFIGEVLYQGDTPYLKTYAITNIAWDEATRAFYDEHAGHGLEFRNLHTLFGAVLANGEPVIANDPETDPRRGGLPPGHPTLDAFLGAPFRHGQDLVGVIGLANRPGGYDSEMVDFLQPLLATCGNLIHSIRGHAERRRAQQALRDSEERYRLMAEYSSDIIARFSPDGLFGYVSPASATLLGYEPEKLKGRSLFDYVHPDDAGQVRVAFRAVRDRFTLQTVTYRLRDLEGKYLWLETSLRALREGDGAATELVSVSREVTERVRAAQDLNRFKHMLDNTLDMLFMFEPGTLRFTYLNRGAVERMGFGAEELLKMAPWQIQPLIPEGEFRRLVEPLLSGEKAALNFETVQRRKDGGEFQVEVFLQYVREIPGRGLFVAIVRDITERKKIDRLKNEFVSTVSHELRTPLTSIRGSLGLVVGGVAGTLPAQAKGLIEIAYNNSERLVRLINDILDIEKIESGNMQFEMASQPLMPLIEQAVEANQAYGEQFGVSFRIVSSATGAVVRVDGHRLAQVMSNLLSNAAKFSPPGAVVEIAAYFREDTVRVEVIDHGPGIPKAFRDKVFQKFCQADASDSRQKSGTGLGLNISRTIMEKLGGFLGFSSELGLGTTFHFELPLAGEEAAGRTEGRAVGPRVLVCEDDPDSAKLLTLTLGEAGFVADVAYDAAQAKAALDQRDYLAMTLDLGLPDQDGLSLLRDLRASPATADLPVVVVSARAAAGRRRISGGFRLIDWIEKPLDRVHRERLLSALDHAVRGMARDKARVLHVEDDPDVRQVVAAVARDVADFDWAGSVREAADKLAGGSYQLVILDLGLPGGEGWELLPLIGGLKPQPPVLLFSVSPVGAEQRLQVAKALTKSSTSNQELLDAIRGLVGRRIPAARRGETV